MKTVADMLFPYNLHNKDTICFHLRSLHNLRKFFYIEIFYSQREILDTCKRDILAVLTTKSYQTKYLSKSYLASIAMSDEATSWSRMVAVDNDSFPLFFVH